MMTYKKEIKRRGGMYFFAVLLVFALILGGCTTGGDTGRTTTEVPSDSGGLPQAEVTMSGKIAAVYDTAYLIIGADDYGLYFVQKEVATFDETEAPLDAGSALAGQTVEIGFSGMVMESYPMQPAEVTYLKITGTEDDMVGFYAGVIDDLWTTDEGLNSDIEMIALDLSEVSPLTDGEREALVYVVGNRYGLQTIRSTYDDLVSEGLIDDEALYFEKGILIDIRVTTAGTDQFTFDISKWRSGLGAYFFIDCEAERTDDGWTYTVGSEAIS
jgi:hypothetical protein